MKVVINKCYGGFGLSPEATLWLLERGYNGEGFKTPIDTYYPPDKEKDPTHIFSRTRALKDWHEYLKTKPEETQARRSLFVTVFSPDEKFTLYARDIPRNHPLLIECVETLGAKANGACADLDVVEIPDGIEWEISEYDGNESIEEKHRSWR